MFSPDGETASNFRVALAELGLEVAHCRDIFGALEQVTRTAFEVMVSDSREDPEAGFLFKSAFELRPEAPPFAVAVAPTGKEPVAKIDGVSLVIHPLAQRDDIKYALLGCDAFLQRMNRWQEQERKPAAPSRPVWTVEKVEKPAEIVDEKLTVPIADSLRPTASEIVITAEYPSAPLLRQAEAATREVRGGGKTSLPPVRRVLRTLTWGSVAAGLIVGITFGYRERQILAQQQSDLAVALSSHRAIRSVYDQAARTVVHYLPESPKDEPSPSESAPVPYVKPTPLHTAGEMKVDPVAVPTDAEGSRPAFTEDALNDDSVKRPMMRPGAASRDVVPDSLRTPSDSSASRNGQANLKQSGGVEPVNLPETQADEMLVEKVPPAYPQQALDSGLEGPVVFQAWIARDGSIRDLKLIRGPMMLGQAAYNTVKKWRYRPYSVNGEVMEAKTFVTVNFSRP